MFSYDTTQTRPSFLFFTFFPRILQNPTKPDEKGIFSCSKDCRWSDTLPRALLGSSGFPWTCYRELHTHIHSPNKAQPLKPERERKIFMALPARPRFLIATHIPHSVTVKYSLPLSQLIKTEASNSSVCCVWRKLHRATVDILTDRRQCVHHVALKCWNCAGYSVWWGLMVMHTESRAGKGRHCRRREKPKGWQTGCNGCMKGCKKVENERQSWTNLSVSGPEQKNLLSPRFVCSAGPHCLFFKMSAVISSTIMKALQQGARCLQRRGPQAASPGPSSEYEIHTHTHILALFSTRTWDKRLARWGCVRRNATVPQLSTTAELKGGDQQGEKRLNVKEDSEDEQTAQ